MSISKIWRDFIAEVRESSDCISNAIDFLLYKADEILTEAIHIRNPYHKNNLLQKINTDWKKSYEYILTYLLHEKADNTSIRGGMRNILRTYSIKGKWTFNFTDFITNQYKWVNIFTTYISL